jgi:Zn-dependent peptidase ImmA (M78 family)
VHPLRDRGSGKLDDSTEAGTVVLGERIRQARKRARFSLNDVASRVGVSAQAISNYERGRSTPGPRVLQSIARELGVQTEFFFRTTEVRLYCPRYRKACRFGVKAQAAIEEEVKERLERYLEVEALFPPERFSPPSLTPCDVRPIRDVEQAEEIAADMRRQWELGTDPIENMAEALEDRGFKVLQIAAEEGFDGLACWANATIPVVVANANKPWDRQRFDLAHELGELVLQPGDSVDRERAAHRFAGAFLVPREVVRRELGSRRASLDLKELGLLKEEYGLSMQAWARRALDTNVISKSAWETFCQKFSALGLRRNERTADRLPDRARRFELLVLQAKAEDLIGPARAAELLGQTPRPSRRRISEDELRSVVDAAQGYYTTDPDALELAAFAGDILDDEQRRDLVGEF